MAAVFEGGSPKNLTASGAISSGPCTLLGFYVNSTTGGTIVIKDGGSGGTALCGTITPAIGFHRYPAAIGTSAYATLANTIDVTFFYVPAA
jgi:hypothetical protein